MATKPTDLLYGVDEVRRSASPRPRGPVRGLISVYLIVVVLARAAASHPTWRPDLVSLALVAAAIGTAVQAWGRRFFGSSFRPAGLFGDLLRRRSLRGRRPACVAGMTSSPGWSDWACRASSTGFASSSSR
jgi:hypothetical protein